MKIAKKIIGIMMILFCLLCMYWVGYMSTHNYWIALALVPLFVGLSAIGAFIGMFAVKLIFEND